MRINATCRRSGLVGDHKFGMDTQAREELSRFIENRTFFREHASLMVVQYIAWNVPHTSGNCREPGCVELPTVLVESSRFAIADYDAALTCELLNRAGLFG